MKCSITEALFSVGKEAYCEALAQSLALLAAQQQGAKKEAERAAKTIESLRQQLKQKAAKEEKDVQHKKVEAQGKEEWSLALDMPHDEDDNVIMITVIR